MAERLVQSITDHIAECRLSYADIDAQREELAAGIAARLTADFGKLGFSIEDFRIEGINFDEDTIRRIGRIADMTAEAQAVKAVGMDYRLACRSWKPCGRRPGMKVVAPASGWGWALVWAWDRPWRRRWVSLPLLRRRPRMPGADATARLAQLKQMHEQALITAEEYSAKKKQILRRGLKELLPWPDATAVQLPSPPIPAGAVIAAPAMTWTLPQSTASLSTGNIPGGNVRTVALPLQTVRVDTGAGLFSIERCERCFGLFFDVGEVQAFLEASVSPAFAVNLSEIANINEERATLNRPIRYMKCPECGVLMNRMNFGAMSGVVVDQCKEHGMWLDNGELVHLMEWKKAGGQLLAQKEKIAQQEQRD